MRILLVGLCLAVSVLSLSFFIDYNNSTPKVVTYDDMIPTAKTQISCLAKNVYFEAGNQEDEGMMAVALVTLNRVHSKQFAGDACSVVHEKLGKVCQFSWICENTHKSIDKAVYNRAKAIALYTYVNYNKIGDITHGATYYHATYVNPGWEHLEKTVKIGKHIFYKPKKEVNNHDEESKLSTRKQFWGQPKLIFTSNGQYYSRVL